MTPSARDERARRPQHVREAHRSDEGLRVVLAGGADSAAEVNALLVSAGLAVSRLEPVRHSLEQRFLEITSRLDADARGGAGMTADGPADVRTPTC